MQTILGFIVIDKMPPDAPLGWKVISWAQSSPVVHCFLAFNDKGGLLTGADKWTCYETTEELYESRTLSGRIAGSPCELYKVKWSCPKAYEYCKKQIGVPYDYPAITGFGLALVAEKLANLLLWPLNKFLGRNQQFAFQLIGNPLDINRALFCSESVVNALNLDIHLFPEWWRPESTMPRQVYEFVKDNPHFFEPVKREDL